MKSIIGIIIVGVIASLNFQLYKNKQVCEKLQHTIKSQSEYIKALKQSPKHVYYVQDEMTHTYVLPVLFGSKNQAESSFVDDPYRVIEVKEKEIK